MNPIALNMIGGLGNRLFQYAYAKKLAETSGRELRTHPWSGQVMFEIDDPPITGGEEILPENYRQDQESLIYTREDCRRWFKFRPELVQSFNKPVEDFVAHYRAGDYLDIGYPVISKRAIQREVMCYGYPPAVIIEESPERNFMEDFWLMTQAEVLFRANSSFSYWAAVLGTGEVYSPVIDGLAGGIHDKVDFVEGNHPRLANFPFTTNLHLPEK